MADFKTIIEVNKMGADRGMERFLKTFSFVPDDKLNYSPTATSKPPIQIAAHLALSAADFADIVNAKKMPGKEEFMARHAKREAEEKAFTDRKEIERVFRENTAKFNAALDQLKPEDLDLVLGSDLGWEMPMSFFIMIPSAHAQGHAGQIEYLQTCWNDQEMHF